MIDFTLIFSAENLDKTLGNSGENMKVNIASNIPN